MGSDLEIQEPRRLKERCLVLKPLLKVRLVVSGAEVRGLWSQRWMEIKWVNVSQRSLMKCNIMRLCRPARGRKGSFSLQIAVIYSHKQHTRIRCWNITLYPSRPVFLYLLSSHEIIQTSEAYFSKHKDWLESVSGKWTGDTSHLRVWEEG